MRRWASWSIRGEDRQHRSIGVARPRDPDARRVRRYAALVEGEREIARAEEREAPRAELEDGGVNVLDREGRYRPIRGAGGVDAGQQMTRRPIIGLLDPTAGGLPSGEAELILVERPSPVEVADGDHGSDALAGG